MTPQLSDCCKATIDLDKTKERPECYTCSRCGRIIGSPLPPKTKCCPKCIGDSGESVTGEEFCTSTACPCHTTKTDEVEEMVEELYVQLEAFTSLNGNDDIDAEGIIIVQDWLRAKLSSLHQAEEERITELVNTMKLETAKYHLSHFDRTLSHRSGMAVGFADAVRTLDTIAKRYLGDDKNK